MLSSFGNLPEISTRYNAEHRLDPLWKRIDDFETRSCPQLEITKKIEKPTSVENPTSVEVNPFLLVSQKKWQKKTIPKNYIPLYNRLAQSLDVDEDEMIITKDSYFLIRSPVQSGKTRIINGLREWTRIFMPRVISVVCVDGLVDHARQLLDRSEKYFADNPSREFHYLGDESKKEIEKLKKQLKNDAPPDLCVIANPSQLRKLLKLLSGTNKQFILVIDEADQICYGDEKTKRVKLLRELSEKALRTYEISATIYTQMFWSRTDGEMQREIPCDCIINIEPPSDYCGYIPKKYRGKEYRGITCYGRIKESDDYSEMKKIAKSLLKQKPIKCKRLSDNTDKYHPIICLFVQEAEKVNQEKMQSILKDWQVSFIYNSDGCVFVVKEKKLMGLIKRIARESNLNFTGDILKKVNEKTLVTNALTLLHIASNKYNHEITHIGIVSGHLANRGISFVDSSHSWHLTHEFYNAPVKTHQSSLEQKSFRCAGIFNDNLRVVLYTTRKMKNSLKTAYEISRKSLETISQSKSTVYETLSNSTIEKELLEKMGGRAFDKNGVKPPQRVVDSRMIEQDDVIVNLNELTAGTKQYNFFLYIAKTFHGVDFLPATDFYRIGEDDRQRIANWYKSCLHCTPNGSHLQIKKVHQEFQILYKC